MMSVSAGSWFGNWIPVESTTELNVESLEVAVSSTAVPSIEPVRWKV